MFSLTHYCYTRNLKYVVKDLVSLKIHLFININITITANNFIIIKYAKIQGSIIVNAIT